MSDAPTLDPDVYTDIDDDTYFSLPYASKSALWRVHNMPETVRDIGQARRYMAHADSIERYCFNFGRAFDDAVCRSPRWPDGYEVWSDTKTAGKGFWAAQAETEKTLILEADMLQLPHMQMSVMRHPKAGPLLLAEKRTFQPVVVWDDEATGIRCKGKIDLWTTNAGRSCHVDLKTFSPKRKGVPFARQFSWDAEDMGYMVQVAHYLDGCASLDRASGRPEQNRLFKFIVVNTKPEPWDIETHAVHVAEYEQPNVEAALRVRDHLLAVWQSINDGTWKPSPVETHTLQLSHRIEDQYGNQKESA